MTNNKNTHATLLSSKRLLRLGSSASLLAMVSMLCSGPAFALSQNALPTGGSVSSGSATIDYSKTAPRVDVTQGSQRAVIDWNTFDVGEDATAAFHQSKGAIAVNRVRDVNPSQIMGHLQADGTVIILNGSGVAFGKNATVDVGGLVASTGQIDEQKFMKSGAVDLHGINTGGKVVNEGRVTVADKGIAAFVAPDVENSGTITAKLGRVALAAGADRATVDLYGDRLVELALDEKASKAVIENSGTISAEGGMVALTAAAASNVVDSVINTSGVIEADTVDTHDGRIVLKAQNADIVASGTLSAKGEGKENGGTIAVTTDHSLNIAKTAKLDASAGTVGNGGTVAAIAEKAAFVSGSIAARGGSRKGNGGTVETSGKQYVQVTGSVDAGAKNGAAGSWTIDPRDIVIDDHGGYVDANGNATDTPTVPSLFDAFEPSYVDVAMIKAALDSNTGVYITTNGSPAYGQPGDIRINQTISVAGGNHAGLTLDAAGSVIFTGGNGIRSTNGLNVTFIAGNDIYVNRNIAVQGVVTLTATNDIYINSQITSGSHSVLLTGTDVHLGDSVNVAITPTFTDLLLSFFTGAPLPSVDVTGAGYINAQNGNILINNSGVFHSAGVDTLRTNNGGTITLNQSAGGSIQNAISAVSNGGSGRNKLILGAGTFNEQVAIDQSNFLLQGAGQGQTTVAAPMPHGMSASFNDGHEVIGVISAVNQSNVTIDGLTVDGRNYGANATVAGVAFRNTSGEVKNTTIKDFNPAGAAQHQGTDVYVANTDGAARLVKVTNSQLQSFERNGILMKGTGLSAEIKQNTIWGYGTLGDQTGIKLQDIDSATVRNNTITQVAVGIQGRGLTNGTITNNTTTARTNNIYLQDSRNLDVTNNTTNGGSSAGILLNNVDDTLIDGNQTYGGQTAIFVFNNADGNTVSNNVIHGQGVTMTGMWLGGDNTLVSGNTVTDVVGTGIGITGGNARVTGNTITNTATGILALASAGIDVSGNTIDRITDTAIDVRASAGATVTGNTLGGNGLFTGVQVTASNGATVIGNSAAGAIANAYVVNDSQNATVANNTATGGMGGIVINNGGNVAVSDNSLTGLGLRGIVANNVATVAVNRNTVSGGGDAITFNGSSGVTASRNTITQGAYGIVVTNADTALLNANAISGVTTAGFLTSGAANGTITLTGNTVASLGDGAHFASGTIDLASSANSFNSANDGLVFDPLIAGGPAAGTLGLAGNSFGSTVMTGQGGYFIRFANAGMFAPGSPTRLDATNVNFDGFVAGSTVLSQANYDAIEARLFDFNDDATLGLVNFTVASNAGAAGGAVDQSTILPDQPLNQIAFARAGTVTILGLPYAPGAVPASVLAGLDSASGPLGAGGDNVASAAGLSPEDLNNLDSASGPGDRATCWGGVYMRYGRGNPSAVTFSLDSTPQTVLSNQADCATGI